MHIRCRPSLGGLCGVLLAVLLAVGDATATNDDSMVLAADYSSTDQLTPEELSQFADLYDEKQWMMKRDSLSRAIPFSGGMYGKRSLVPFSGGIYGKRRGAVPFSGGIYGKRAMVPFSGGMYGKRAMVPFSGGMYGKRGSFIPFSGGMYGKRDGSKFIHSIRSRAIPMSGGLYG